MSIGMTFHRCVNFRLDHTYKTNANSVTLVIVHNDGAHETEVTLFDLPCSVTDKLKVLRDEYTTDTE